MPAVLAFFGLGIEVRHVTLSAGQLTAAAGALGPALLASGDFWRCVVAILGVGMLNVGVSFTAPSALRCALRACASATAGACAMPCWRGCGSRRAASSCRRRAEPG